MKLHKGDELLTYTVQRYYFKSNFSVFSRLNAGGVYLNLGLVDPAFIRNRRLFVARRLFIKCIFRPFLFLLSVLEVY